MALTQDRLKELLSYNPITGIFTRNTKYNHFNIGDVVGSINGKGYLNLSIESKPYSGHRIAFLYMEGAFPEEQVDHIDGNKSNNIWSNLRKCKATENMANLDKSLCSKAIVKGVTFNSKYRSFNAEVCLNRKRHTKRFFVSVLGAVVAREQAILWVQETRNELHKGYANHG